jgi:murein DD-endopeptidase MepM/ murein hydrolase activator NlpD
MSSRPFSYSRPEIYLPSSARGRTAQHAAVHGLVTPYTLTRGARQLRLRPFAFWLLLAGMAGMALWTITTATYFAFREDVLTRLVARQTEMQFGYEDRIAELRAQVDRITSRQLLDQEQYEQKVEQILRRQTTLESRTDALSGLTDVTSSIRPEPSSPNRLKLIPLGKKGAFLAPHEVESPVPPGTIGNPRIKSATAREISRGAIAKAQASLDQIEQRQAATLDVIEKNYQSRAQRIRWALTELGVETGKGGREERIPAVGGPFVAPREPKDASSFDRQLYRISVARIEFNNLARALNSIPLRKPLDGEIDLMSGFGVRQDPFSGAPAMHTGLDLHGKPGDPVRASADGTVTAAGWSGGYGRSVDIDHGNGLSTRYAHLSAVDVQVGQRLKAGQVLGRLVSTGRSTGPHLHYETRVKGEAVDPHKFLRAEAKLAGIM